jgi:hypothetical protein
MTVTTTTQIRKDLEDKLLDDVQRAVDHFLDMADVVEMPEPEQFASVMYILSSVLICGARSCTKVTKEIFALQMINQWNEQERRFTALLKNK